MVPAFHMGRTNIEIDEKLVRSESRKGILCHYGSGIWKGDVKAMRRNHGQEQSAPD